MPSIRSLVVCVPPERPRRHVAKPDAVQHRHAAAQAPRKPHDQTVVAVTAVGAVVVGGRRRRGAGVGWYYTKPDTAHVDGSITTQSSPASISLQQVTFLTVGGLQQPRGRGRSFCQFPETTAQRTRHPEPATRRDRARRC